MLQAVTAPFKDILNIPHMHRPRYFLKPEENQICVDQEVSCEPLRREPGPDIQRSPGPRGDNHSIIDVFLEILTCCLKAESTLVELQGLNPKIA